MNGHTSILPRLFTPESVNLDDFKQICSQTANPSTYPLSNTIEQNIPIYDLASWETAPPTSKTLTTLQDEWHHILHKGPGVFILRNMYPAFKYSQTLTATNAAFDRIIAHEKTSTNKKGDHFAASGTNDRIWNAFQKHGLQDPPSFLEYYSNPWLALVCNAWLGPNYRITAQVNAVHPGGAAQDSHRDYHLGFQEVEAVSRYPGVTQVMSQFLTLQGAVAHTHMPVESGPTRFLPFSQMYEAGYLAWRRGEFREFFQEKYVSAPLSLGDGVFFNPALFHAAGANEMDENEGRFRRVGNLLQVSSAFGKAMEMVDSLPLIEKCWEGLEMKFKDAGGRALGVDLDWDEDGRNVLAREVKAFVQAVAEGYPFPTNLDARPPAPSGMAPESEQDIVVRGLVEGWGRERVVRELRQMRLDSRA